MLIVVGILYLQDYGQKVFELIFLFLIGTLGICVLINFFYSKSKVTDLLHGLVPNIPKSMTFNAVIGSIVMP